MRTKSILMAVAMLVGIASCGSDEGENMNVNSESLEEILAKTDTTHLVKKERMPVWLVDMFAEWEKGFNYRLIYQGETTDETVYYIPDYASSSLYDSYYHQDGTQFTANIDRTLPKPLSGWTLIYIWRRN